MEFKYDFMIFDKYRKRASVSAIIGWGSAATRAVASRSDDGEVL